MSFIPPGPIDHVGIAVRDLEAACVRYRELLGAEVSHRERVAGQGVEIAYLKLPGDARIELLTPIDDDGPVARFLEKRGEGMHHVHVHVFRRDGQECERCGSIIRKTRLGGRGTHYCPGCQRR